MRADIACLFACLLMPSVQASSPAQADAPDGVSLLDDRGSTILVKNVQLKNGEWRACFAQWSGQVWLGHVGSYIGRNHAIIEDIKPAYVLVKELVPINRGEWAMSSFEWPAAHPATASKYLAACNSAAAKSG